MPLKVNQNVKRIIIRILQSSSFLDVKKVRKAFIISVFWHVLIIKGKITFNQFGRFSQYREQSCRIHFEQEFYFLSFNIELAKMNREQRMRFSSRPLLYYSIRFRNLWKGKVLVGL